MAGVKVVKCSGYIVKFCKECTSAPHDCCNDPNDELYISPEDAKNRLLPNLYTTPIIFSHKNLPTNVIGHVTDAHVDAYGIFVSCYLDNATFLNLMKRYAEGYFVTELDTKDVNLPLFYKIIFPGYSLSHNPSTFETDHLAIVGTPRRKGTITTYEEIDEVPVKTDNEQNWMDISGSLYTYTLANSRIGNRKELLRENAKHSINKSTLFIEASHNKQAPIPVKNEEIWTQTVKIMDPQERIPSNVTDVLKSVVDLCNKQQQQLQTFYVPPVNSHQPSARTQFQPMMYAQQPMGYFQPHTFPMNDTSDLVRRSVEFGREYYPKGSKRSTKRGRPMDYDSDEDECEYGRQYRSAKKPFLEKEDDEQKQSYTVKMMDEFMKTITAQQEQFMKKFEERQQTVFDNKPPQTNVEPPKQQQRPMDPTNYLELVNNITDLKKMLAESQIKHLQQQQQPTEQESEPLPPPPVKEPAPTVPCGLQDAGYVNQTNKVPVLINAGVSRKMEIPITKQSMVADALENIMMDF